MHVVRVLHGQYLGDLLLDGLQYAYGGAVAVDYLYKHRGVYIGVYKGMCMRGVGVRRVYVRRCEGVYIDVGV